jgi:hypothetical protein
MRPTNVDNANIIQFLLDSLQVAEHTHILIQLLLTQDKGRKPAWQVMGQRKLL